MLGLAGEALSSHEVPSRGGATSKTTSNVKSALELGRQSICNLLVDPIVFKMAVARITATAVESQAGKEI